MEDRKELTNFGLITDIDKAKPVYERIFKLTKDRIELLEKIERQRNIGDTSNYFQQGLILSKIKSEIGLLKQSVEYVRTKMFILVAKSYLTKEQMNEINLRCEEILSAPELHLIQK